jgi:hypothetical protein
MSGSPEVNDLVLGFTSDEITARFRDGVRQEVAEHLAAGNPVYGIQDQQLVTVMPNGRKVAVESPLQVELNKHSSRDRSN